LAGIGKSRTGRRRQDVAANGTGHHRINELGGGDAAQRLGLVGVVLRRCHLRQGACSLLLQGRFLIDARQRLELLDHWLPLAEEIQQVQRFGALHTERGERAPGHQCHDRSSLHQLHWFTRPRIALPLPAVRA
jgi:hypothetical protein